MSFNERLSKARRTVAKPEYIHKCVEGNADEGVYCKLCGRKLIGLVESEKMGTDHKGRYRRMIMMALPGFVEVDIEMIDKEGKLFKHITPLCKPCSNNLSEDDLDNIWCLDVCQWEKSGKVDDYCKTSRPVKVVKVREV